MASQEIEALSQALARLPGLGPRSARRAVLHLMKKRETALQPLLTALRNVADKLSTCSICGNVDTSAPCSICRDPRRDEKMLCVVEEVADLWALDRSRLFPGRYHVLGGRLSALEGVRPEDLSIDQLVSRGLLHRQGPRLKPTPRGLQFLNDVLLSFVVDQRRQSAKMTGAFGLSTAS